MFSPCTGGDPGVPQWAGATCGWGADPGQRVPDSTQQRYVILITIRIFIIITIIVQSLLHSLCFTWWAIFDKHTNIYNILNLYFIFLGGAVDFYSSRLSLMRTIPLKPVPFKSVDRRQKMQLSLAFSLTFSPQTERYLWAILQSKKNTVFSSYFT